jgi:hypothetical protein
MSPLLRLTLRFAAPLAACATALAWALAGAGAAGAAALGAGLGAAVVLSAESTVRGLLAPGAGGAEGAAPRRGPLVVKILLHWGLLAGLLYATMAAYPEGDALRGTHAGALGAGLLAPVAALVAAGWRLAREENR